MLDNYDDYKTGGTHKVFSISVVGENITITNENLRTESIVLDEELCSSTNLKFGSCGTSKFTAEIANVFENFEGKLINVTVTMDNEVTKYGTFKVFSDKPIADRIFRSLTAYDAMNDIIKTNVLSWYNSLTFPITLKNFRDSFFNYLGITQETTTLVNDNFIIPGGFTASDSLMGGTIITAICELNGVFGHINRDGKFEYIDLTQSESFECPPYENGSVTYEDYVTSPITKVTMRGTASDVGTSVGVAGNEYIIQGNPLIYGTEGTQALTTAITNLLNKIKTIVFRPFDLRKTIGNPCVEIGDAITIDTKYETITSYVLRRTLTGIQALRDRYSASGSRVYPAVATSYSNEITRTQGKIHEVEVSLDEFRSEVSQTYVTQTAYNSKIQELQDEIDGAIESFTGSAVPTLNNYPASDWTTTTEKDKHIGDLYQVNSQGGSYAGFYYRFDKTNNVYSWVHIPDNEVQKALADAAEANRKAEAAQDTADGIASDLSTNYSTTQQMNSAINQKANEITQTVSTTYETKSDATNKLNTANTNAQGYATQAKNDANAATDSKLTHYYTKTQTDSAITQKANEITLNVSENYTTKTEFGNLEIGGTNLIRNTHDFKGAYINVPARASIKTDEPIPYVHFAETEVTWNSVKLCPSVPIELINGKTITVSAEVRANEAMGSIANGIVFAINGYSNAETLGRSASKSIYFNTNLLSVGEWVKLSYTIDINLNDWSVDSGHTIGEVKFFSLSLYDHAGKSMDFRHPKLEIGNKVTDWSPAPEDTETNAVNTAKSYTDAQLQITSSSILSTVEQGYTTKTDFNNLSIGGENRFAMSELLPSSKWTFESSTGAGTGIASISGRDARIYQLPSNGYWEWKSNTDYTISIEAKDTGNGNKLRIHAVGLGESYWKEYELTSDWKRYVLIVTAPSTGITANGSISFYCASSGGSIQVRKPKVEYGNRVTDWSPASEDMSSKSEVQQLSNKVTVKVNSSGRLVTAELGADPASSTSYVKVKADDIDIIANGNIQLTSKSIGITSSNFTVTPAGVVTCSNITATGGSIGGWTIESDKLSKTITGFESCEFSPSLLKLSDSQQTNVTFITPILISVNAGLFGSIGCGYETSVTSQALNIDSNGNLDTVGTISCNTISPKSGSEVTIASNIKCNTNGNLTTGGEVVCGSGMELGMASASSPAHIDFHWDSNDTDYTARIIQRGENTVDLIGKNSSTWGIWRAASFNSQSSKYVKKNIKDVTEKEAKNILKLRPVKFDYKNDSLTNQRGLIAEEVLEVMPEMVNVPKDYTGFNKNEPWNTPSIDYSKFVPYIIKMIQIQQKEIDDLKK